MTGKISAPAQAPNQRPCVSPEAHGRWPLKKNFRINPHRPGIATKDRTKTNSQCHHFLTNYLAKILENNF